MTQRQGHNHGSPTKREEKGSMPIRARSRSGLLVLRARQRQSGGEPQGRANLALDAQPRAHGILPVPSRGGYKPSVYEPKPDASPGSALCARNGPCGGDTAKSASRPPLPFRSMFQLPESCRSQQSRGEMGDLIRPGRTSCRNQSACRQVSPW